MAKSGLVLTTLLALAVAEAAVHFQSIWIMLGFMNGVFVSALGLVRVLFGVPFSPVVLSVVWLYSALGCIGTYFLPPLYAFGDTNSGLQRFMARVSQNCSTTRLMLLFSAISAVLFYYIIAIAKGNFDWLLLLDGFSLVTLSSLLLALNPNQASEIAYGFIPIFTMAAFELYRENLPQAAAITIYPVLLAVSSLFYFAMDIKLRRFIRDSLAKLVESKRKGQILPSSLDEAIVRYFPESSSSELVH